MKQKLLLITIISAFLITSCKKDNQLQNGADAEKLTDVKVPEGFTWESSRDVALKVSVTDMRFNDAVHVITVYSKEGKLLTKGSATVAEPFQAKVYLPAVINELYIIKTAPDNSSTSQKVVLDSKVAVDISLGAPVSAVSSTKNGGSALTVSPNCTVGCTQSVAITSNNQTVTVSGGKTVCVTGSNKSFDLAFTTGGGTLRLCGTNLTIKDLSNNNINAAMSIIITAGSTITFDDNHGTNFNQNNNTVINYGTVTFNGGINLAGVLTNYGTLNVDGEYSTETQTDPVTVHTNNGTMVINGKLDVGSNSLFYNNGTIKTTDLRVFNHSTFYNYCKLWVTDEYDHSITMKNYGYIKVDNKTFINGSSELAQYSGAMLSTKDIKINGTIKGYVSTSLVKVTSDTDLTGAGLITGTTKYCDANGLEKNNGTISGGAALSCDLYIPISGCNTEGNGSAVIIDSDGDGVSNSLDDYPNDATKAYNNYYPSADSDAGATVAFEDQWPAKGDYDMNDVVLSYSLKVVTNAQNIVVEVNGTYDLQARGGIFQNGFGIEFPVNRSLVSNVTGGTLEEGQQKAVIILFTNMHAEMLYFNTRKEDPVMPAKAYPISFKVTNGPTLANFGLGEYNPFIWNRTSGRGYEIHLPGKTPTTLANTSLFGTGSDKSNAATGKYYVTAEGYPWAISIPTKTFNYPVEGKDIATVYLKMPLWVASGGSSYTDWYSNTASGYRNVTNIFK